MFSLNFKKIKNQKEDCKIRIQNLLCKRQRWYRCPRETHVTEQILMLNSIHASVISPILWFHWIQWKFCFIWRKPHLNEQTSSYVKVAIKTHKSLYLWKKCILGVQPRTYMAHTFMFKGKGSNQGPHKIGNINTDGRRFEPSISANALQHMWIEKAQLPCWPPYSQQVSHHRWIGGLACRQEST